MRATLLFNLLLYSCSASPVLDMPDVSSEVSIAYLKSLSQGIGITTIDKDIYIEGVVISSDRMGNIYKRLFIEDASAGIEIIVDHNELFKEYAVGHRVSVRCNALALDSYRRLGIKGAEGLEPIGAEDYKKRITVTTPNTVHLPMETTISKFNNNLLCKYIIVKGLRFVEVENGASWANSPDMYTNRILEDVHGNRVTTSISPYCEFADYLLPLEQGTVVAILYQYGGEYQILLSSNTSFIPDH